MNASVLHFSNVVDRIEANSWWAANFAKGKSHPGFTYRWTSEGEAITEVPVEPFESLLLHVRKLTMKDGAENMHKVRKALKQLAKDYDQALLDVWHKYWRLAFAKEPFEVQVAGEKHLMTPYKVYDCFVNGELFHSNDPKYNVILHGAAQLPEIRRPSLFLRNIFHSTVVNLCFAALGLKRYIDNGSTFMNIDLSSTCHPEVFRFVLHRGDIDQIDEQYRIFNDWLTANGGIDGSRWA